MTAGNRLAQKLRAAVNTLVEADTIPEILAAQSQVAELAVLLADRKALAVATRPRASR